MARVKGTAKAETIVGTPEDDQIAAAGGNDHIEGDAGNDHIEGEGGNDWIDGGPGDDALIGGKGNDRFVLRKGGGHDVIYDFKPGEDTILFDFGTYSDAMVLGRLSDGQTWENFKNTARWRVLAWDNNGDGIKESTLIQVFHGLDFREGDSIIVQGLLPGDLWGQWLRGG